MKKEIATVIAKTLLERFKNYFKSIKNFGAYTTMVKNQSKDLKTQVQWLKDYSIRKGFDLDELNQTLMYQENVG